MAEGSGQISRLEADIQRFGPEFALAMLPGLHRKQPKPTQTSHIVVENCPTVVELKLCSHVRKSELLGQLSATGIRVRCHREPTCHADLDLKNGGKLAALRCQMQ
jgi:hypothetical protein